jgi:MFS family permease
LVLIVVGMIPLTMLDADTSVWTTTGCFFVMGLGMGMTMMPTMTAALRTLKDAQIARGSTLMNITQQVAASIGTAVMSVILTTYLKKDLFAGPAILANSDPAHGEPLLAQVAKQAGTPVEAARAHGLESAADSFSKTIMVALILIALTLIPAAFLPRKRATKEQVEAQQEAMVDPVAAADY